VWPLLALWQTSPDVPLQVAQALASPLGVIFLMVLIGLGFLSGQLRLGRDTRSEQAALTKAFQALLDQERAAYRTQMQMVLDRLDETTVERDRYADLVWRQAGLSETVAERTVSTLSEAVRARKRQALPSQHQRETEP
jgi:hypothetical protein